MMVEINLLPPKTRQQRWGKIVFVSISIIVVMLASSLFYFYQHKLTLLHRSQQQLAVANTNFQRVVKGGSNSSQIIQFHASVSQVNSDASHIEPLMMTLISLLPDYGYLTSFTYNEAQGVILLLHCRSLDDVSTYLHLLQQQNLITDVQMGSIKEQKFSTGQLGFVTQFTIKINQSVYQKLRGGT